jgi:sulfur carrier protein
LGGFQPKYYNNARDLLTTENQVTVNGERQVFEAGTTLLGVVQALRLEPDRVAVELDRSIVKRALWETTEIRAGAEIEIVMFVGGGSV